MTPGLVLKIAFGVVCFGIGAACLILAICVLPFIQRLVRLPQECSWHSRPYFYGLLFCCYDGCAGTMTSSNGVLRHRRQSNRTPAPRIVHRTSDLGTIGS